MSAKRHIVTLTETQRARLQSLVYKGREHAFRRRRAQSFLQVDEGPWSPGRTNTETAQILTVGRTTVERARRAFTRQGLAAALQPSALDHPRRARRLNGAGEAELTQLAGSPVPAGTSGWTLQLLADRLVALQVVDSIGRETVRVALKKLAAAWESPQLVPEDGAR